MKSKPTTQSTAVRHMQLRKSLSMMRTNIIAAGDMAPMQRLRTAQLANELAARLRHS
ncbi:hypothetical protein ACKVMH_02910 [Lysobacter zhanggongensis]|uniref:Uncharacterized protein n=1 Tax=Lysobacter zhanggongensis TaxID=1774951 RepID=A0ABU7YPB5_9GAMM